MAYSSKNPSCAILVITTTFIAILSSTLATSKESNLPSSTISAAPALLPDPGSPLPAPALSPDMYPDFPSPGGSGLSPAESSVPLIPSSPSPPNPDSIASPEPAFALSPLGVLPDSYSCRMNVPDVFLTSIVVLIGGIYVNMAL
ncbi:hypothetical protein ABFS83_04G020900 [Erythranthe nasuta]